MSDTEVARCDCGYEWPPVPFDEAEARKCGAREVRRRWPRGDGPCPECGQMTIRYASFLHYLAGDW